MATELDQPTGARTTIAYRSGGREARFVRLHESEAGAVAGGRSPVEELHREIEGRGLDGSWVATNDPTVFQAAGYSHALSLPVRLCLPVARRRRVTTYEADEAFLASGRFEAIVSDLDDFPVDGWVQRWTPDDLCARLRTTGRPYLVHVGPWVVGISARTHLKRVPAAVLLKLLPRGGRAGARRAVDIVTAACRGHHVPLAVYAGVNAHAVVHGVRVPSSWLPTPTDIMFRRPGEDAADDPSFDILELFDLEPS